MPSTDVITSAIDRTHQISQHNLCCALAILVGDGSEYGIVKTRRGRGLRGAELGHGAEGSVRRHLDPVVLAELQQGLLCKVRVHLEIIT